ncbi:MAG: J domain-containing protein [Myxococcales bacterium]|nr:J domain-containing protein [Myxococcales bacterium]
MTELLVPVVSITRTRRGRYLWAAWWTTPPRRVPFQQPDASDGGSRSPEDALRAAEQQTGRSFRVIEPIWARGWNRILRGEAPFSSADVRALEGGGRPARPPAPPSLWAVLGVEPGASVDEIKRAFRERAPAAHPDRGGDPEVFRQLHEAYERALAKRQRR